ncbi:proline racemase family protein [Haloterrigena salifodinae]|uniref:proline racemase family protein n=1 Tax=Haloterrigena salifodinae TaxID=2675099 RepID=UPI0022770A19|nr:proline racemase family protein [Haloterrigena salifodinae]
MSITELYASSDDADRSIVVFGNGQVDRSPCRTDAYAKMALLYEEGRLAVDESSQHESILGTQFEGRIVDTREADDVTLIAPQITESARITGKYTFVKDPRDPITGFSISSIDE